MEGGDIGVLVGTFISLLLLILGVAIGKWPCATVLGSTALTGGVLTDCTKSHLSHSNDYLAIGVLLVIGIVLVGIALIFTILYVPTGNDWMGIAAVVCVCIGALLALIAMLYYYIQLNPWTSPILATIGMAFAVAVAIFMVSQKLSY